MSDSLISWFLGQNSKRRLSKITVMELLDKKFKRKAALKEKELELRRLELELKTTTKRDKLTK